MYSKQFERRRKKNWEFHGVVGILVAYFVFKAVKKFNVWCDLAWFQVPVEYVSKVKAFINGLIAEEYIRRNQPSLLLYSEDEL